MMTQLSPKILLLTTQPPSEIRAEWPFYQNWTLPEALKERGALVNIRCWRDPTVVPSELATHDVITFLWCNNYHVHPIEFPEFIRAKLLPAKLLNARLKIMNDSQIVLWNTDKSYLEDLGNAGFLIPKIKVIPNVDAKSYTSEALESYIAKTAKDLFANRPVVLKPSISGSSKQTHLLRSPSNLTPSDRQYLASSLKDGIDGSLIMQAFEPAIANGEYSLVFIAGQHTHTMVKVPAKNDFRCQAEFGGNIFEIQRNDLPHGVFKTAERVIQWMESNIGSVTYCRVDGVVRDNGDFALMELEAIEPHLWLETCSNVQAKELLYNAILDIKATSTSPLTRSSRSQEEVKSTDLAGIKTWVHKQDTAVGSDSKEISLGVKWLPFYGKPITYLGLGGSLLLILLSVFSRNVGWSKQKR